MTPTQEQAIREAAAKAEARPVSEKWPETRGGLCAACGAPLFCSNDHRAGCWAEAMLYAHDHRADLLAALDAERAENERLTHAHDEEVARNRPLRQLVAAQDARLAHASNVNAGDRPDRIAEHEKQMADMRAALTVAEDEAERLRGEAAVLWDNAHVDYCGSRECPHTNPYRPSGPRNT